VRRTKRKAQTQPHRKFLDNSFQSFTSGAEKQQTQLGNIKG